MKRTDEIIVEQERGRASTVEVRQEHADNFGYSTSKLIFTTDQKLTTGSGRACAVREAIHLYCNDRGYRLRDSETYTAEAIYDARHHSGFETYQIEGRVKEDVRFQTAADEALQRRDVICQQFGKQIVLLKNLTAALEHRQEVALQEMRDELIAVQVEILGECDIPSHVSDDDRQRLFDPNWPLVEVKMPYHGAKRDGKLPDSIDEALALLAT